MKRTALITGASRGLGLTLAKFLAAQSYRLVVNARDPERLAVARRELESLGAWVRTVAGDIAEGDTRSALASAAEETGRLDLLVNNASDLGPSPMPSLFDYPPVRLERLYRRNVIAPLALIQTSAALLERSRGLVVNISSDAARGAYEGWGGYGSGKAALDLISLTLAKELKDKNISVVSVDPGDMRTAMHQAAFPGEDISDRPLPEVTVPFWAWLLNRPRAELTGRRFEAQAELWTAANAEVTP